MSKLKTVWDAVNELRGDLNNTHNFNGDEVYLFYFVSHDSIGSSYSNHGSHGDINNICTIAEFKALVEEMELGLDVNPVNHGHYLNYVYADKSPLEKDSIVKKPLVYTQEMADNGELPSVGSEFLHKGSVATTLSTSNEHGGVVTFTVDNGCSIDCCWNNDAWVKPIDTRTKKEKAIDEIESELSKIAYSTRSALELAYDEWVGE